MIATDQELEATQERIRHFQAQLAHLRRVEKNAVNYALSASGFLAEIDRMQFEAREYLALHPSEELADARANRGNRKKFRRAMAKVSDRDPDDRDRL